MGDEIIRNSTADFLIFMKDGDAQGIQVYVQNETVWLTQKAIAALFDTSVQNVVHHIKKVFEEKELDENSVIKNYFITASDGKKYNTRHYNLDVVIAVGYRINSLRATQFRQWATKVLSAFSRQGYVLDHKRLENGQVFSTDYFDRLTQEYQEIRASERLFYQKVTDIYATAYDYSADSKQTREFFAKVQNKMHFAVHGKTAAEVIASRADHAKRHMGLTTWAAAPKGRIVKQDVSIAKNYLSEEELRNLNEIVSMYLDYATRQAKKHIPMSMEDWATRLDVFLEFNDEDVLQGKGKVTHAIAKAFAESEFEKYRVIQEREYQSDFDIMIQQLLAEEEGE